MIRSQLHFEAVFGQAVRGVHDAGIVDENVQLILLFFETIGKDFGLRYCRDSKFQGFLLVDKLADGFEGGQV